MEGPDYAVNLRAVEPRLGRVQGSGQTTWYRVSRVFVVVGVFMEEWFAYLALAKGPEVGAHADDVVETRVGALVDQQRT
jgi:hypothetical protein